MAEDYPERDTSKDGMMSEFLGITYANIGYCVVLYLDERMETVCQNDENIMVDCLRGTCWPDFRKFPTNFANESLDRPAGTLKVHYYLMAFA